MTHYDLAMNQKSLMLMTVFTGIILAGCNQPHPPVQPPPQALRIDKDLLDDAWDEALEVLREHYFIPDRQDRRAGLIVTYPTNSKQWFEFWRDDAQGGYEVAESSIHNVRRLVEVRFVPAGGQYEIRVCVRVQRKSQPPIQITDSAGTLLAFRDRAPLMTGETPNRASIISWVGIGEDVKLANYLLRRIERRLPESDLTEQGESTKS